MHSHRFGEMRYLNITPDDVTYTVVMSACAKVYIARLGQYTVHLASVVAVSVCMKIGTTVISYTMH